MGESVAAEPAPAAFGHVAMVPGLTNQAQPAFPDVDRFDSREFEFPLRSGRSGCRRARVWKPPACRGSHATTSGTAVPLTVPERKPVAMLRVAKAQFGTAVWLNGEEGGRASRLLHRRLLRRHGVCELER
ncbi:MAG: hypothetical protein QM757_40000 [Paludibaculum sp.]